MRSINIPQTGFVLRIAGASYFQILALGRPCMPDALYGGLLRAIRDNIGCLMP